MAKPLTLTFAHANGFNGGSYRTFLQPFHADFAVHPIDQLGHDPRYPVGPQWQALSEELEAILAELPKPLVGMGHSLGGILTFMVAQRHPDWFAALVMLDPPLLNGAMAPLMRLAKLTGQVDRIVPARASERRRASWSSLEERDAYFARRPFFQRFDPRCLADYLEAGLVSNEQGWQLRFDPAVEAAIFRHTPDRLGRYAPLKVPGLLVSGAETTPAFLHAARRHVRRHRMEHVVAPGTHMFVLEQPEQASQPVLAFLQAQCAGEPKQ